MRSIFTVHGIGQGLFYSANLDDGKINFVYDCGTESKQSFLKTEIDTIPKQTALLLCSKYLNI